MTETHAVIEAYRQARSQHVRVAMATVVSVEGSAYRRPGARMVVTETGLVTGVISGGCLESDVTERASMVLRTGHPILVSYDTTAGRDPVWGLGTGCNGVVQVLIEPESHHLDRLALFIERCSIGHRRAACATVIRTDNDEFPLGARVLLDGDGAAVTEGSAQAARVSPCLLADLEQAVQSGVPALTQYDADARVQIFVEVIDPRIPLVIFGAGADVSPLVTLATHLGWHVTVVDTHARLRSADRFSHADNVILCRPEDVAARVTLSDSSAVVLMTHNYQHDLEVLRAVRNQPVRYLGCLGPRHRTDRLMHELADHTAAAQPASRALVRGPVGLDIGAETSSEIALAIAAEILAVIRGRWGGPLCQRHGPIHRTDRRRDHASMPSGVARWPADVDRGGVHM